METRASHLLIGGFVLLFVVGLFGFAIWLARIEIDREFAYYDIYFTGSVAGLGVGGDVRYRGIKVGTVVDITINPDDPSRVGVTAQIGSDTPIREGDRASLQLSDISCNCGQSDFARCYGRLTGLLQVDGSAKLPRAATSIVVTDARLSVDPVHRALFRAPSTTRFFLLRSAPPVCRTEAGS